MITFFQNALEGAILSLPAIAISIGVLATQGIAWLMGIILDWVISPGFVSYSYTKPCSPPQAIVGDCNPIVGVGLQITQGLINLILVVILVYVAISIALRLGGEQSAKKVFVKLIVIALLVNFAPLLVGLIVDAANIMMNFFLTPIQGGTAGVLNQNALIIENIWSGIWNSGARLNDKIGLLAVGFGAIVLNLGVAFAFFLFAGLFIFRYLAIWILVILSPIAFVFWIFPEKSKFHGFWDRWWNQLIQWSIIGIPIAFFLYLALGSFSAISQAFQARLSGPLPPSELSLFSQLMPFAVTTAFLGLGFIVGLATSAMGASAVMAGTKTTGKWLGKKGVSTARGIPAVSKGEEKVRRRLESNRLTNWIPGVRPGTFDRQTSAAVGAASKRLEEIPDTYHGNKALQQIATKPAMTLQGRHERAATIELLAKRKSLNFTPEQAKNLIPEAQRYGADAKTIYQARPDFAPYLNETDPATGKQTPMSIKGVMDKITPGDFGKNVQKEALKNYHVALEATLDDNKFKKIGGMQIEHKKAFLDTFQKDERFSDRYLRGLHDPEAEQKIDILNQRLKDIANKPQWKV